MKNILFFFFFFFVSMVSLLAQIDPEYLLELKKGTTAEMNAITPVKGVLLYNTDDDKVYRFDGASWLAVGEDGDWTRNGNNQHSAVPGNVGIGTATPNEKLEVKGNAKISDGHLYVVGTNPSIKLNGDASSHYPSINFSMLDGSKKGRLRAYGGQDALLYEFNNHVFRDSDSGTELVRIKQSGDVGIGTNNPVVHLSNNTSSISADMEISTTGKTGVDGRTDLVLFSDLDGANPANIFLQGKLSNGKYGWATWAFRGNHSVAEYKDWVDFGLSDGDITREQVIRMNALNGDVVFNEGKVGVGILNPTKEFDVQGNIAHSGSLFSRGANYSYPWMSFQEQEWGNSLVLGSGGTTILGGGEFAWAAKPQFDAGDEKLVLGSDYNIGFYTHTQGGWGDVIHAMEITNAGMVGIGTATPLGNLHVSSGDSGDAKLIIESDTDDDNENDNPMLIFRQDGGIEMSAIVQEDNGLHLKNGVNSNGAIIFDVGAVNGYENTAEAMRVNYDGNVGIKTATPRSDLDVSGVLIEGNPTPSAGSNPAASTGSCVMSHAIASFFTSTQDNNYIHIKLPYKIDTDNRMYYIKATGYRYNSSDVIDLTWVGYCYAAGSALLAKSNVNNGGTNFTLTQYVGSDNHIYLRFRGTVGTNYYQSFRIDSMYVGNGMVLKEGDVQIISSASATL